MSQKIETMDTHYKNQVYDILQRLDAIDHKTP